MSFYCGSVGLINAGYADSVEQAVNNFSFHLKSAASVGKIQINFMSENSVVAYIPKTKTLQTYLVKQEIAEDLKSKLIANSIAVAAIEVLSAKPADSTSMRVEVTGNNRFTGGSVKDSNLTITVYNSNSDLKARRAPPEDDSNCIVI